MYSLSTLTIYSLPLGENLQGALWKKIEEKLLTQRELIGDSTKEINKNLRIKMDQQNETLGDVLMSVRRIVTMVKTHMRNVSDNWDIRKETEANNDQKLNESEFKLNGLTILTSRGLEAQTEIKDQIHVQLEAMTGLQNQLKSILENSSFTRSFKTAIEENLHHYDVSTRELKFTVKQTEYKILKWMTNIHQEEDVDEVMQELIILEQGNSFRLYMNL